MNSDTVLRGYYMAARGRVVNTPTREDTKFLFEYWKTFRERSERGERVKYFFQQFNSTPKGVPSPLLPFQGSLNLSVRVQETVAYHLASNFEYSERNVNNGKVIFSG